ncbi:transcriptional regulator [Campylobacter mucosalis]|uniref:transcriptional regulator n=1 Tax=Campylobacter mucosalis TaxID=202 RepID=UPI0014702EC7|nr:transcriptional regulator [Campylobacter mucosalis]
MTKRDMAYFLDIDVATLYNWRKHKPNLYKIVMLGFKFDELIIKSKQNYEELSKIEAVIKADIEKFKEKSD